MLFKYLFRTVVSFNRLFAKGRRRGVKSESANNRLKYQAERLLQMAKLDKEDIGLSKEKVDVDQIIRDAIHNSALVFTRRTDPSISI